MKNTLHILLLLLLANRLAGQRSFTVQEAVDYALAHNAGLENSRLEQQIAETNAETLGRNWYPQAAATYDFRYNPILPTTLLPAEVSGGPDGEFVEAQFGTSFSSGLGLTVRQKVYDPVFRLELELTELDRERAAQKETYERALAELRVRAAYYQALLGREAFQNSQSLLQSLAKLRQDVQVRVENELENPSLLHTLEQQYRQQLRNIRSDSLSWLSGMANLKLEMSFPNSEQLELADTLALTSDDELSANPDDNYDMQLYHIQQEASRNALSRLERSRLPAVEAEGYIGAQFFSQSPDLYNFNRWYGMSYIGLTASVPIYEGNSRRFDEQAENLRMKQVQNEMQAYRIRQENKMARAIYQLESAREEISLARAAIRTAEENLALARTNYRNEVAGFQAVFDSLQRLVNSRGQLIAARASYVQALLEAQLLDL